MNKHSKLLFKNDWVSTYIFKDWYVYAHESRTEGGQLVAAIPFTTKYDPNTFISTYKNKPIIDKIYGHYEICPAHGDGETMNLTAIAGAVDKGDTPIKAIIKELEEEGGIQIKDKEKLIYLNNIWPTASSDTLVHLYAIDITGMKLIQPKGDGSFGEHGSYNKFVSIEDALNSMSSYLVCGTSRLLQKFKF